MGESGMGVNQVCVCMCVSTYIIKIKDVRLNLCKYVYGSIYKICELEVCVCWRDSLDSDPDLGHTGYLASAHENNSKSTLLFSTKRAYTDPILPSLIHPLIENIENPLQADQVLSDTEFNLHLIKLSR